MGRYAIPVVSRLLELNGGKFISAAQVARGGPGKDYVAKLQAAGKLEGRRCGCSGAVSPTACSRSCVLTKPSLEKVANALLVAA